MEFSYCSICHVNFKRIVREELQLLTFSLITAILDSSVDPKIVAVISLFLLVIMHLFAKMDITLAYNAYNTFCGCMPPSFLLRVRFLLIHVRG